MKDAIPWICFALPPRIDTSSFYEHYAMKVGLEQLRFLLSILGKGEIVGKIFFLHLMVDPSETKLPAG